MRKSLSLAVLAASTLATVSADAASLTVLGTDNIFGSGSSNSAPEPGGGGGGTMASMVGVGGQTSLTLSATGTVGWAGSLYNGPDGGYFASSTNVPSVGGISGFSGPRSGMLVGVFLDDSSPDAAVAPSTIMYGGEADYELASYAPELRQVFFVGDGEAGGNSQTFFIPTGATRFYLGFADAFGFNGQAGYYNDNVGSLEVRVEAVPEPGTMAAIAMGLAALARRRRN